MSCQLSILHTPPNAELVKSVVSTSKLQFRQSEPILWNTSSAKNLLHICKEKIASDEDEIIGKATTCEAETTCSDEKDFAVVDHLVADQDGVFKLFYFVEDEAKNRSKTVCKNIVVSGKEPLIQIKWDMEELNKTNASLPRPLSSLSANISVRHFQRLDSEVNKELECKVDFTFEGNSIGSGESAKCESKECKGSTLEKFLPCSKSLSFSLDDYWKRHSNKFSRLTLHVRTNNHGDPSVETKKSIWIYPNRWNTKTTQLLNEKVLSEADFEITEASGGRVFFNTPSSLYNFYRPTQNWEKIEPPENQKILRLISSSNTELFAISQANTNSNSFSLLKLEKQKWHLIIEDIQLKQCLGESKIILHEFNQFSCLDSNDIIHFNGNRISSIKTPRINEKSCKVSNVIKTMNSELWISCDGKIFEAIGDTRWNLVYNGQANIKKDKQDRIWILDFDARKGIISRPEKTINFEMPHVKPSFSDKSIFFNYDNSIVYEDYAWNETNSTWMELRPGQSSGSALYYFKKNEHSIDFNSDASTNSFFQNFKGMTSRIVLPWNEKERYIVKIFHDINGNIFVLSVTLRDHDYSLTSISNNNFTIFNENAGLTSKVREASRFYTNYWLDSSGTLNYFDESDGFWESIDDGFVKKVEESEDNKILEMTKCDIGNATTQGARYIKDLPINIAANQKIQLVNVTEKLKIILFEGSNRLILLNQDIKTEIKLPVVFSDWTFKRGICAYEVGGNLVIENNEGRSWILKKQTDQWRDTSIQEVFNVPGNAMNFNPIQSKTGKFDKIRYDDQKQNGHLLDLINGSISDWKNPTGGLPDSVIEIEPNKFVVTEDFKVFLGDGSSWKIIFEDRSRQFGPIQIDAFGRFWLGTHSNEIIQIDAK